MSYIGRVVKLVDASGLKSDGDESHESSILSSPTRFTES